MKNLNQQASQTVRKALTALCLLAATGPAFGADWQQLSGHVPAAAKQLPPIGRLAATNRLHLAIGLPPRDQAGLDAFLRNLQDPASPGYHQYLSPEQFTGRFGPTAADYQAVVDFAVANHLTVLHQYPNRVVLSVDGAVADIEQAFHVKMLTYRHPTEARTFYAPDAEPSLALSTPLAHISGLDNYALPHPQHHRSATNAARVTPHGSGPGGRIWGNDYRNAYVPGTALTGAGQSMGFVEFETYYPVDLTNYVTTALGLPASRTPAVTILAIQGSVSQNENGDNGVECSLDLEVSFAMAPGVTNMVVFCGGSGASFDDIFATMVEPAYTNILQFSCSWGGGTGADPTSETLFQQMQAQGQSFYNATGDNGAFAQGAASLPSDSPSITQVGGSSLTDGSAPAYAWVSESAWDDDSGPTVAVNNCVASSGGFSAYYQIPYWQTNLSYLNPTGTNQASTAWRNFPDVSANGEENNEIMIDDGSEQGGWGGTSFAAPQWCGFTALINQQLALFSARKPVGFLNPALYALAQQPNAYTTYFHDVVGGNNINSSNPTGFFCTAGYDLVCGIGTPMGTNLINALTGPPDPLVIIPADGFTASGFLGGPFAGAPQTLTLTNAGANTFSWSLINTSAWLAVSAASGVLAAGSQTTVSASLTAAANSLSVGAYGATVLFSNQATQVAQLRQFSLQVSPSLAMSPTNGFAASGAEGGNFSVSTQSYVLTNLSASPVAWGILNTSLWLTASPAGGTLAGGAQTACALALSSSAYSLPVGVYTASVQVTNQGIVTANLHFTLQVLPPLAMSPTNGFVASGGVGGSFSVSAQNYVLTNLSVSAVAWGIVNTSLWLTASPAGGTLAGGAQTACTIGLSSSSYSLPAGVYTASVLVTNRGSVTANLPFTLQVGQSVVQNGGFETGSFADWTLVGYTTHRGEIYNAVETSSFTSPGVSLVHSGNYGAALGESGSPATLSQTVPTVPGQNYLLSFWLINPTNGTTQIFAVNWSTNGTAMQTLYGITNPPAFSWTNLTFVVTATSANSTIQFAVENDPYYFGLDDVSLAPIPTPRVTALARTGNNLAFTWYSLPGLTYVVQYKTNLSQANWISLSTNTAAAGIASYTNVTCTDPQRFYRVQQLQ